MWALTFSVDFTISWIFDVPVLFLTIRHEETLPHFYYLKKWYVFKPFYLAEKDILIHVWYLKLMAWISNISWLLLFFSLNFILFSCTHCQYLQFLTAWRNYVYTALSKWINFKIMYLPSKKPCPRFSYLHFWLSWEL